MSLHMQCWLLRFFSILCLLIAAQSLREQANPPQAPLTCATFQNEESRLAYTQALSAAGFKADRSINTPDSSRIIYEKLRLVLCVYSKEMQDRPSRTDFAITIEVDNPEESALKVSRKLLDNESMKTTIDAFVPKSMNENDLVTLISGRFEKKGIVFRRKESHAEKSDPLYANH